MGHRGSGRYARGDNAVAICERCSAKRLRRELVYDGQYPDLLVCPECWDPKHPQEYLPDVTDPVTIYDPTGDPDKGQANVVAVSWPPLGVLTDVDPTQNPLQIGIQVNQTKFNLINAALDPDAPGLGEIPGPVLIGNAPGEEQNVTTNTVRPPLPGAGSDPDVAGSIVTGNLLLIFATSEGTSVTTLTCSDSAYRRIFNCRRNGAVSAAWYKIAASDSEVAPTITSNGTLPEMTVITVGYSNVDQSDPIALLNETREIKLKNTNPQTTDRNWYTGKLKLNPGDKAISYLVDAKSVLSTMELPTPTTVLSETGAGAEPTVWLHHWSPADNPEMDNLLGTTNYADALTGFTANPVGAVISDFTYQGAFGRIMEYNAISEETWLEKDFAVEAGKSYWVGALTGVHQASIEPDYCAITVDDGTSEDGRIYKSLDGNALDAVEFGNNIGSGFDESFAAFHGARGTIAFFKYTASVTGNVTFRFYMTDSSTSLTHTTNMTAGSRGIPVMSLWACEANDANPTYPMFPPFLSATARANAMNSLFFRAGSRSAGGASNYIDMWMIGIRGNGSPANNADPIQFPICFNTNIQDTDNRTMEGPSPSVLSTSSNNKIYSQKFRPSNTGQYYCEFEVTNPQPTPSSIGGISFGLHVLGGAPNSFVGTGGGSGQWDNGVGVEADGLRVYQEGIARVVSLTALSAGDIIGLAVDFDNDSVDYYINNVLEADLMTEGGTMTFQDDIMMSPAFTTGSSNTAARIRAKLKSSDFTYTPPSGYSPWSDES